MKRVIAVAAISLTAVFTGCGQETSGGPGATSPSTDRNILGQEDNTFSIALGAISVRQGESMDVPIDINRGKNFRQDVELKFAGLPQGVSVAPGASSIKSSETESTVSLMAASNAALGDFTVTVTGHPASGVASATEVKLSVNNADPEKKAQAASAAEDEKREKYADAMELRIDGYDQQFEALEERAANANEQTKSDLDVKVAVVQVKLDAANEQLDTLRAASQDQMLMARTALEIAIDELRIALN